LLPETKNKAFISAYCKGIIAANCGILKLNCPYPDKKNSRGGPTWSRVFRRYWAEGHDAAMPKGFCLLRKNES